MTEPIKPESARTRASNYFTQTDHRDNPVRQEIEKKRAAQSAKTAKLRALRLAKETADKQAQLEPVTARPQVKESAPRRKRMIWH